mgnify:CR=1 FL=1
MKNIYILLTLFLAVLFAASCETYDDYEAERPAIIGFTLNGALELPLSTNNPTITFPVPYFVSEASSSDRIFRVVIVEEGTELAPENYSFNPEILIPANERIGTMPFIAMDVSLTTEYVPLVLAFESSSGVISGPVVNIALKTNN